MTTANALRIALLALSVAMLLWAPVDIAPFCVVPLALVAIDVIR